MNQLQTYKYNKRNYFVDYKLKQFRSDTPMIDFVDFDTDLGDRILCKMLREDLLDLNQYNY